MKRPCLGVLALLAVIAPQAIDAAPPVRTETHAAVVSGVPDVPEGAGRIHGRLLHDDPSAAAGKTLVLYSLNPLGVPGLRSAVSNARGEFAFEAVTADPDTVYFVGVRSNAVPFGTRVVFAPGETTVEVEIHLAEPSADPTPVLSGETRIRIDRGCSSLRILETHELTNPTARPIYVPEDARSGRAVFDTQLPDDASGFASLGAGFEPGMFPVDGTLQWWGPLRPGLRSLEFAYTLPLDRAPRLLRPFRAGARRVVVLTHPQGVSVRGKRLRAGPSLEIEGRPYRTARTGRLAPGTVLDLTLEIPPAPAAVVSVTDVRIWLEVDDAALTVHEEIALQTLGEFAVADSGAPILCLRLPEDIEGLRFSSEQGVAWDASGALAVHGPVPAGPSKIGLQYRLPTTASQLEFSRRFGQAVPLLSIFVADTQLRVESDGLHRRRPVRSGTRNYLYLEGFAIGPEQTVSVRATPLPLRRPFSKLALTGLATAAAVAAASFLGAPLRRRDPSPGPLEAPVSRAANEREFVYAAIRKLDDDFEAGEVDAEDHARYRDALRAEAVALLRSEELERSKSDPSGSEAPAPCPRCRALPDPSDRFCSQCGAPLAAAAASSLRTAE